MRTDGRIAWASSTRNAHQGKNPGTEHQKRARLGGSVHRLGESIGHNSVVLGST